MPQPGRFQSTAVIAAPLARRSAPLRQTDSLHPRAAAHQRSTTRRSPRVRDCRDPVGARSSPKLTPSSTKHGRRCVAAISRFRRRICISIRRASPASPSRDRSMMRRPFLAHLADCETRTFANIDDKLHHYKTSPLRSISTYRRALGISRLPRPLRGLLWWRRSTCPADSVAPCRHVRRVGLWRPWSSVAASAIGVDDNAKLRRHRAERRRGRAPRLRSSRSGWGQRSAALADLESVLNNDILAELRDRRLRLSGAYR